MAKRGWILLGALGLAACGSPPGAVRPLALVPVAAIAADSSAPNFPPSRAIDASTDTAWSNGGYKNATAWIRADLGSSRSLAAVGVKSPPGAGTYDVQTSADGVAFATVLAGRSNTTWGVETKALPAGTAGRFVRLFWRNNAARSIAHFDVYHLTVDGGTGTATPTPAPSATTTTAPTAAPTPSSGALICPAVTPAPGGGTTCYPAGTVFQTGNARVTIGAGGVFTPAHVYVRPGASTTFVNVDSRVHDVTGFNGATSRSGPLQPGATYTHSWAHAGTWYFHDTQTANPPTWAVTDVPQ